MQLKKLRANTSNDGGGDDDGSRGDRRLGDGDGSHSDDGDSSHSDDGGRTKLRLEPHCRLRLRQLRPLLQRSSLRFA